MTKLAGIFSARTVDGAVKLFPVFAAVEGLTVGELYAWDNNELRRRYLDPGKMVWTGECFVKQPPHERDTPAKQGA